MLDPEAEKYAPSSCLEITSGLSCCSILEGFDLGIGGSKEMVAFLLVPLVNPRKGTLKKDTTIRDCFLGRLAFCAAGEGRPSWLRLPLNLAVVIQRTRSSK